MASNILHMIKFHKINRDTPPSLCNVHASLFMEKPREKNGLRLTINLE